MSLFPQSFIDDVRLTANILQVIQEYVPLRKVGRTYKGLCPFHAEKTPSFHVDPEKGFFHCFGCNAGGDVFKFLERQEKLTFPEAVRLLAQKAGMTLPEAAESSSDESRQDAALREGLLKAHEVAAAYFREQLVAQPGARARQQLADRGVTAPTLEQMGLGYAPPTRDGLRNRLLKQGFSESIMTQSGLIVRRDNGELIDRFRNRLMVPICRDSGAVIAFGGRAMDGDQVPKYLNSPETAIYSKGRTLYGLHLSRAAIRKLGYAVLVEGYFDFAQVFQSNAAPVVASCGTALTTQQAGLLRRFTTRIVLSFDPDAAGQGAAARSSELLVTEGFEVNVVVLDKGEDPDTFIRRNGGTAYRERLRTSQPYLEYLLDQAATGVDLRREQAKRQFLDRMLGVAKLLPDAAMRDQFAEKVAFKAQITDDVVFREFRKLAVKAQRGLAAVDLPSLGELKKAEKDLVWALIHDPEPALAAIAGLEEGDIEPLATADVLRVAQTLHDQPLELVPSELLRRLSTMNADLVTSIAAAATPPTPAAECVRALKRLRCEREHSAVRREIDRLQQRGETGAALDALLADMRDIAHRIEQLR